MEWILEILVWSTAGILLYSYGLYPVWLEILLRWKPTAYPLAAFEHTPPLPVFQVSILMAAYNEEAVLDEKLRSLLALKPFGGTLRVFLGSDASEDGTDGIAQRYMEDYPWFSFIRFGSRTGKPSIINQLAAMALEESGSVPGHILLISDANILFHPELLQRMLRHFRHPQVAVVDSTILPVGLSDVGISKAEHRYLSGEARLKFLEGVIWGTMIGPFGGCYAIRSDYFRPVPAGFLVDDFFITLSAISQGGFALSDPSARCWEKANDSLEVEWKRKRRIGAGNFQNMHYFRHCWWPPWRGGRFAFFSHKILRWIGPHLMLLGALATAVLACWGNQFYGFLFVSSIIGLSGTYVLDLLLRQWGIQLLALRGIRYFFSMNAALFSGWLYFLNGIKSNVWERTKRAG